MADGNIDKIYRDCMISQRELCSYKYNTILEKDDSQEIDKYYYLRGLYYSQRAKIAPTEKERKRAENKVKRQPHFWIG